MEHTNTEKLKYFIKKIELRGGYASIEEIFIEMIGLGNTFLVMSKYDFYSPNEQLERIYRDLKKVHDRVPIKVVNKYEVKKCMKCDQNHYKNYLLCFGCMIIDANSKPKRKDGQCKICGDFPRVSSNIVYCIDCRRAYYRRKSQHKVDNDIKKGLNNVNVPCSRCGLNPRYVQRNGNITSYCEPCTREYQTKYRSEVPKDRLCTACNERPRSVTKSGVVNSRCRECIHAYYERQYGPKRKKYKCKFCNQNERYVNPDGIKQKYCLDCYNSGNTKL